MRSYDVGFTVRPVPDWTLSGAAYYVQNEDEIVLTAPDTYSSVGETTRKGFELETRYRVSPAFDIYASYGRILEAEIKNPLPGSGARLSVPRDTLKAGVAYRTALGPGHLTLHADAFLTRRIPYYSGTPLRGQTMPSYTRYDLRATYDYRDYQVSAYWVSQPHRYASEAAYATAAGLWIAPQPRHLVGLNLRRYF